jgi:CTP synthase (UTP-ammonia lyase)
VAKLVRDDAGGKAERVADLMQVITELTNECLFREWTGQEPSIGRQRIKRTKETKASEEFTRERIYGDHTFRFEFAERHVNRPLIRSGSAQAVAG